MSNTRKVGYSLRDRAQVETEVIEWTERYLQIELVLEMPAERGQRERALRFERLCYRAHAEGTISLSKAAQLLRLPISDVEAGLKGPQNADADRHQ